ncbi:endo-1,4-beta-xylanase [Rhizobium sp. LjRoot254]|uniref:endo-1,4-beta-xylanase n=1 Tax=Rhizobium sp. LjRoot254 TaxID=3342297 RepID=UPI003ECEB1F3
MNITRRSFLAAGAAMPLLGLTRPSLADEGTLRQVATDRKLIYGTAVSTGTLAKDKPFAQLVIDQANMLVAEGETKRKAIEPKQGRLNFAPTERLLAFAEKNGQRMRGHTLLWHEANPDWLLAKLEEGRDDKLLTDYIEKTVGHFKGRMHSWDVINEVIHIDEGGEEDLRISSPWYKAFGSGYIETAFQVAHAADPDALLFYNEINLEADVWWAEQRRTSVLKLLEKLLKKGIPVHALGIQSHLKAYRLDYTDEVMSRFLDEVSDLGLKILITEFDIADVEGPADPAQRDADIAALGRRYLDVAFSKPAVLGCLTWGISDRYSWLSSYDSYKWSDGSLSRGLPFDGDLRPKKLYFEMLNSYRSAS